MLKDYLFSKINRRIWEKGVLWCTSTAVFVSLGAAESNKCYGEFKLCAFEDKTDIEHRKLHQDENWTQRGSACTSILLFETRISAQRVYVHDTAQTKPNTTIGGGHTRPCTCTGTAIPPPPTNAHTYVYLRTCPYWKSKQYTDVSRL